MTKVICESSFWTLYFSFQGSSSENGETNFSSIVVEPSPDLPALECINVPDVNTEAEVSLIPHMYNNILDLFL